ncbi:unnamed protein product [Linum tenue]|uniref:Uncharacterized protein n=1 Tax=Linum tenue TaxID=586396 RepID=A0AAV0LGU7_9ROSI|nr:unnamed protein product [Linum tenue]
MNGPDCMGKSDSKEYDDNVGYLLNTFVSGTKQSRSKNQDGERTFLHSWPGFAQKKKNNYRSCRGMHI